MRMNPRSTLFIFLYCAATSIVTIFLVWVTHLTYIDFSNLERVPGTAWTALVLGAVAFVGVLVTTSNHKAISEKQLDQAARHLSDQLEQDGRKTREQLEHDSQERSRELNHEMRREVYLELAAEVSKASSIFGRMTKFDYDTKNIADELDGLGQATAKVAVVANQETAFAAERFHGAFSKQLIELLPDAQLAVRLRRTAEILKSRFDDATDSVKTLVGQIQAQMAREGESPAVSLMKSELARRAEFANAMEAAWRKEEASRHAEDVKFVHVFYSRHVTTIEPRVEVQYLLRRELGLECDKAAMLAEARAAADLAIAASKEVLDRFTRRNNADEAK